MASSNLSPGVFTNENDLSAVQAGISAIGAAFVGPTLKGPAFVPTEVYSFTDFTSQFGQETPTSYIPYAVRNYLRAGKVATITRVLGDGGWSFNGTQKSLAAIVSGSTIIALLHPTLNENDALAELSSTFATGSFNSFNLLLSGSDINTQVVTSLNPTSKNYITKVLGNGPSSAVGSAYPYLLFNNYFAGQIANTSSAFTDQVSLVINTSPCTFTSSNQGGYQEAITPWIVSEAGVRLFRFHHRGDGFAGNSDCKVAISNIVRNTNAGAYSSFTVSLRAFNDTDNVPSVLGQAFNNVTLNVDDNSSYISQIIGDEYSKYDSVQEKVIDYGDYVNNSNYVYVEVSDAVKNGSLDPSVYPAGFEGVYQTVAGFNFLFLPTASLVQSNSGSTRYSGFDFTNTDNMNYLNPIPQEAVQGNNATFFLTGSDNKFLVPFQGGTDGMNYATIKNTGADITPSNLFGFDLSTSTSPGTLSYVQALDILSNDEQYDMNQLVMPGVLNTLHPYVAQYGLSMVESRTDAVYPVDICGQNDTIATAVNSAASLDSNYGCAYYSWVKIVDSSNNKKVAVPPSVVIPQVIAYSDSVSQEWYAPAGLNRGGIGGVIATVNKLSSKERDVLYPGRVNPIASFPKVGIAVWGQKTLQLANTALNRINVRRLLINLRKYTASVGRYLVFEGNTTQTRNQFLNTVRPYFSYVQSKQGVYAITVVMDDSNNTGSVIDQNQLIGSIQVYPVKSAEFIILDFNINPTGTTISNGAIVSN